MNLDDAAFNDVPKYPNLNLLTSLSRKLEKDTYIVRLVCINNQKAKQLLFVINITTEKSSASKIKLTVHYNISKYSI